MRLRRFRRGSQVHAVPSALDRAEFPVNPHKISRAEPSGMRLPGPQWRNMLRLKPIRPANSSRVMTHLIRIALTLTVCGM